MEGSRIKARTVERTNWVAWISLTLVGLVTSGMVITNPSQPAYEGYAVKKLSAYLEGKLCQEVPPALTSVLLGKCSDLLHQNESTLQSIIHDGTQRQNFLLFSLYETTLAIPGLPFLPAYEVNTVGVLNHFFTYRAVQR